MLGVLGERLGMVRDFVSFNNLRRLRTFNHLHCAPVYNLPACLQRSHELLGQICLANASNDSKLRMFKRQCR
jgi:hypothetical protein